MAGLLSKESELTEEERNALEIQIIWLLIQYDNNHFQFESGFLDNETWEGNTNRMRNAFENDYFRTVYESQRAFYRESYITWIDSLIAEIED